MADAVIESQEVAEAPLAGARLDLAAPVAEPPWRISSRRALTMFGAGFAGLALLLVAAWLFRNLHQRVVASALGGCTVIFAIALVRGVIAVRRMHRSDSKVPAGWMAAVMALPVVGGLVMTFFGTIVTALTTVGFARGRQLRRRGKVLLPEVAEGGAWAHLPLVVEASGELRSALAAQWRENGRTEHASVAAFARLTLELISLGAPPELLEAANRDAKDEIRHAELCFSLARALDGQQQGPGPFPEARRAGGSPGSRSLSLARLAVESLIDGALHEGVSARVIARLARRCEVPAIAGLLRELAADEGRHAAHGWDVVQWCLEQGGAPVGQALLGAIEALPRQIDSALPAAARDGSWERYGIHGAALEHDEHARARADLVRRIEDMVQSARLAA